MGHSSHQSSRRRLRLEINLGSSGLGLEKLLHLPSIQSRANGSLKQNRRIGDILLLFEIRLEELLHHPRLQSPDDRPRAWGLRLRLRLSLRLFLARIPYQAMRVSSGPCIPAILEIDPLGLAYCRQPGEHGSHPLSAEFHVVHLPLVDARESRGRGVEVVGFPGQTERVVWIVALVRCYGARQAPETDIAPLDGDC